VREPKAPSNNIITPRRAKEKGQTEEFCPDTHCNKEK
jgi:hypothetical protein